MNFFQGLQSALLKGKRKNSSQKDASHLKLLDLAKNTRKTLKKEKGKLKMSKSETKIIYKKFF